MKQTLLLTALLLLPCLASAGSAPADRSRSAAPAPQQTAATPSAAVRTLSARDIPTLVQAPTHGARLIALWSLDCTYCEPNLQALAALQRAHPKDFQLVTVATDSIEQHAAIMTRLRQAGVATYPARAYAEASPDRLNFLLDPKWGGETPRVLMIRADGTRVGVSGELTPAQLKKLLNASNAASPAVAFDKKVEAETKPERLGFAFDLAFQEWAQERAALPGAPVRR